MANQDDGTHLTTNFLSGFMTSSRPSSSHTLSLPTSYPFPPTTITPEAKAKRDRQRITRACDACRRMKIKCVFSPGYPFASCQTCKHACRKCTFDESGKKRPKPPTRRDVEEMNAKIESLENLLCVLAPNIDLSQLPRTPEQARTMANSSRASKGESSNEHVPHQSIIPKAGLIQISDFDQIYHDMAELHLTPIEYLKEMGPEVPAAILEGWERVNASGEPDLPSLMANDHRSIAERCMERHHFCDAINEQHYPPPDLAKSLVELYFQKVHPYECILHRGEFMHHYNNGLAGRDCSFRALCYAVFAAASRFSSDCRVTPSIGRSNVNRQAAGALYAAASGSFITPITLPCTLFDLQTMAVLSYVLVGSCSPMTAWFSVGMYLRRAQDVGAHLESTPRWSTSILKDQLRKRAFFYLFGRELQLCLSLGKASCIRHSTETIEHPFIIDDGKLSRFCEEYTNKTPNTAYNRSQQSLSRLANAPCWIAGQAYYALRSKFGTQLKMLWSVKSDPERKTWDWDRSIVKQIAEAIDKHIKYDIPAQARWNPEASSEHDLILTSRLRCLVAYFQISVHRHLISTDPGELKICLAASNSMLDVLDHLRKRCLLEFTATYTPYFITPAALTFIYSACSEESCLSPPDRASSWASAHKCLKVLDALSNTTFQAEKLKSSLDGLIKSCIDEQLYPGSTELGKTIKGGSTDLSTILAISPEITIGQSLSDRTTQVPYPETERSSEHLATVIAPQSEISFDPFFPLELFNVPAPQLDAAFFQHPGTQGVNFLQHLSPSNECTSFFPTLEWLGSLNSYPLPPAPEMSM